MESKPPHERLSRRDFLLLALTGGAGALWIFSNRNNGLGAEAPTSQPQSSPTSPPASSTVPVVAAPTQAAIIAPMDTTTVKPAGPLTLNQDRAVQTYQAVLKHFSIPGSPLFKEAINPVDDKPAAFLWPGTSPIAALAALVKMHSGDYYKPELERVIQGLDAYYDPNANPPGWDSYLMQEGGGTLYYDDDEWVGLAYIDAYRLLKKEAYLAKAVEAFNFSVSGWDEEMEGGIYWRRFTKVEDRKSKNTCSNGPAAVMALQLYQETGQDSYLQWAQKITQWMQRLKSTENGVYNDNIDNYGYIDKRQFTYNTGTPIHTYALLYAIQKDPQFLDEARRLAEAAYQVFPKDLNNSGVQLYHGDPWFVAVLMRGFLAFYEVDPNKDRKYIDHLRQNLDYAWQHARDKNGLFNRNWQGPAIASTRKALIDQAAMVELYALASVLD